MYTVFCIYLLVGYKVLHTHLGAAKSSSYPLLLASYCRQKFWRNILPVRLMQVAQLAE
jgi:hypothetical protein